MLINDTSILIYSLKISLYHFATILLNNRHTPVPPQTQGLQHEPPQNKPPRDGFLERQGLGGVQRVLFVLYVYPNNGVHAQ